MSTSKNPNQQTLADLGANERPLMLEKGNYSIGKPMIPDPGGAVNINSTVKQILETLSKMTERNKKQYIADVNVMNYLLQEIPNDIYNSVDASKEGESLEYVYERLTTLVNIMDRNNVRPIQCQSTPIVDYEDEYQGELQGDSQEDKLTIAMMLLARAITQNFSTPTNNCLHTSSNTRNQAVIQDGRVDIQTKNLCYGGNGNKNAGRQSRNQAFNAGNGNDDNNQIIQRVPRTESTPGKANVQCYNYNEKGHYARDSQKPRVRDAKYFREQMLLAMKDEAGSTLNNEENDFMLDTSYADGNVETVPSYDAKVVSEVNASSKVHEQMRHEQRKTIIQTSDDDQIDSNIIYYDQMLAYDAQREAGNQKRLNNELKNQKMLLQKELETSGLGYKNPERFKKAIAAQQKMYDGEKLHSVNLKIDSPDSEETLEDAEEKQTYFSIPSASTNGSESKAVTSDLPIPKMPIESKLLKMFDTLGVVINGLRTRIDITLLEDRQQRWMSDSQNSLREFYKTDVIMMSASLSKNLKELKEELIMKENVKVEYQKLFNSIKATWTQHKKELDELIKHVNQKTYAYADVDVRAQNQDLLITISELKNKLKTIDKGKNVNTKFDKFEASGTLICVTPLPKNIAIKANKVSNFKVNAHRSKPVTSHPTPINEQGQTQNENILASIESSNSVRRQKSKDTKSKNRVLKNTNAKS
ncbi:hypothetical protein Tco_1354791 [Tanacetum coccineum]